MINSTELYGEKTMLAPVLAYLAGGIYENAKIIYREYIQNACDSIDEAVRSGSLPSHQYGRLRRTSSSVFCSVTVRSIGNY